MAATHAVGCSQSRSSRLVLQLSSSCGTHRSSVASTVFTKIHNFTVACKSWQAAFEAPRRPVSGSSLPAVLFFFFFPVRAEVDVQCFAGHSACRNRTRTNPAGGQHARGTALRAGRDIYNRNSIPLQKKNNKGRRSSER